MILTEDNPHIHIINSFPNIESRFREVHNDKYDYSKSIYSGVRHKIEIWCNKHQEYFWQTPDKHLQGQGCPKCAELESIRKRTLSFVDFVERANITHNGVYTYQADTYKNCGSSVIIICKEHGEFKQKAGVHLGGQGCPKCGILRRTIASIKPFEKFKEEAIEKHNGKYEYVEDSYVDRKTKMKILCPVHGEFLQTPASHKQGHGCPFCIVGLNSKRYHKGKASLYYIKFLVENGCYFKIGITKQSIKKRYANLKQYPHIIGYEVLALREFPTGKEAYITEQDIRMSFKEYLTKDSVLIGNGNSEVFDKDIYLDIQHHFTL